MDAITFVAATLIIWLVWHGIFGIGPCSWIDNFGWEAKKEEEYLDALGPFPVPGGQKFTSTPTARTVVTDRAQAYNLVRNALKEEDKCRQSLGTVRAICEPDFGENEDTQPQRFIQHAEGVFVDDPVTKLVMDTPSRTNADLVASKIHHENCRPECKTWFQRNGVYSCDCGTLPNIINQIVAAMAAAE